MTAISVIVPARDSVHTIGATLDALQAQELDAPFELIVVDNGSNDGTAEAASRDGVRVLRRARGQGPGAARNHGVAQAQAPLLAFTDSDCRPTPGWLAAGLAALAEADIVQGPVEPDPEVPGEPFDRTLRVSGGPGLFESANLFVRRDLFERLGGFGAGAEDADADRKGRAQGPFGEDVVFGWRALRDGASMEFCDEAIVHHAVFRRDASGFISERARLRHFPALAAAVPELREHVFHRRWFLSARTLEFDAAVAGVAITLFGRRRALLAAAPYAARLVRECGAWGVRGGARAAGASIAADAVGAVSLARGSAAARTPLL